MTGVKKEIVCYACYAVVKDVQSLVVQLNKLRIQYDWDLTRCFVDRLRSLRYK